MDPMRLTLALFATSISFAAAVPLAAQARPPCTGVLRTVAGAALAGAEVTFAFAPCIEAPGEPDRVVATTDADGRFAADLMAGNVYTAWAVGPPDETGLRWCCAPAAVAAAGWSIELTAAEQRKDARVQVRGTAAWIAEGPLALRVLVAGPLAAGRDVPIPGDGPVPLPAWPHDAPRLALVNGRGEVVDVQEVARSPDPAVAFAAPRELEVVVEGDDGAPLPGARILLGHGTGAPCAAPLGAAVRIGERLLGVTDAAGKATVRVVIPAGRESLLLRVEHAGHAPALTGWLRGLPALARGRAPQPDDGPLRVQLAAGGGTRARIAGLVRDHDAAGWCRQASTFRAGNAIAFASIEGPAGTVRDGAWLGPAAETDGTFLRLHVASPPGERVLAWCHGQGAALPAIDLDALATWRIVVVDANGRPAARVQLGVTLTGPGHPVSWLDRVALPVDGRLTLRATPYEMTVYATDGTSQGLALAGKDAPPGDLRIVLAPMPVATLHVVGADGEPVAGARLEHTGGSYHSPSTDAAAKELDRIAWDVGGRLLAGARSDAAGVLRVPLAARPGGSHRVRVQADGRVGDELTLPAGGAPVTVTVR